MPQHTENHAIHWQDIPLTLTYQAEWLGLCAHLQFRAGERLPITDTGYKSVYLQAEAVEQAGGAVTFALGLLDEAALSPEWQAYQQAQRQLSLF